MTNDTLTPPAAPSGGKLTMLWSDERILDTIFEDAHRLKSLYDSALTVAKLLRDEYEAALADLRAQLAAAQADNERLHGLLHELRLQGVRLAFPATQLAAQSEWQPVPDGVYGDLFVRENAIGVPREEPSGDVNLVWSNPMSDNIRLCRLRTPAAVDAGTGAEGEAQP